MPPQLTVDPQARGLIFDFDGTLGDTLPLHYRAWQKTAQQYQFDIAEDFFYQVVGMSSENIVRKINHQQGIELNIPQIVTAKNDAYLSLARQIEVFQPVFALVRQYHGKLPIALGTSEYRDIAAANIKATGLARFFDIIVTADDVAHPKPEPDIFLQCAELMKVPPQFCQVFEDGAPGFAAAKRAGMILTDVRPYLREGLSA